MERKETSLHDPPQVPAQQCWALHPSARPSTKLQHLRTWNIPGDSVSTVLHACTVSCDRCTEQAADLLSNCHRARVMITDSPCFQTPTALTSAMKMSHQSNLGASLSKGWDKYLLQWSAAMVYDVTSKTALPRGVLCFTISLSHVYLKYWNSIPPVSSKEEGILPLHFPPAACLFQKTICLSRPETLFTGVPPLMLLIQLLWAFSRQQQIYKLAWFIHCHSHSEGWVWSYPMNFSLVQLWKLWLAADKQRWSVCRLGNMTLHFTFG